MKPRSKTPRRRLDPATLHLLTQLGWGFLTVSVVALIFFLVWYVTRLPIFTIESVQAEGGITILEREVVQLASDALEGEYFKLIPRRFSYLYPEVEITEAVNQISRIKDVAVKRVDRKTVRITYDEYVPDALWCNARESTVCLFLDTTGYAFGEAPNLKGGSFVRYYTPLIPVEIGQTPFAVVDYDSTKEFITDLGETGWYVAAVEVDSVRDVFYTLVGGGEIKATLNESTEETLANLNTIRTSAEFSHLAPGKFEYIDLRFGTKVFVNETREDTASGISTTTAATTTVADTE